jgi:hypothetical protein
LIADKHQSFKTIIITNQSVSNYVSTLNYFIVNVYWCVIGFAYTPLLLLVLCELCICSQMDSVFKPTNNPCHVSGSPAVVAINNAYFSRIVHRIIAGRSSDVSTQCQSIYDKATNLKKVVSYFLMVHNFDYLKNIILIFPKDSDIPCTQWY